MTEPEERDGVKFQRPHLCTDFHAYKEPDYLRRYDIFYIDSQDKTDIEDDIVEGWS